MDFSDYWLIGLSLAICPLIIPLVLCCRNLSEIHSKTDLFGLLAEEFLKKLDQRFLSRWVAPFGLLLISFFASPWIQWSHLDSTLMLRNYVVFLASLVTWKAVTDDVDLAIEKKLIKERIWLFLCLIGLFFYPGFLFPLFFLAVHCLGGWYHHQMTLWRTLQIFLSYLFAIVILKLVYMILSWPLFSLTLITPYFLFLCMISSHYCEPGIRKLKLGESWYSWAWNNRLHYLAASAYMWGWQRSQNKEKRIKVLNFLKNWERVFQFGVVIIQCAWLFSGFNGMFTLMLCCLGILFHLIVFSVGGLFFWQSIGMLAATFMAIINLPEYLMANLFNWQNGFLLFAILVIFPLQDKLWKVNALGWWDTPLIGRVDWSVVGESGREYGLYNDFMAPRDRYFGHFYYKYIIPGKNFYDHLGEVNNLSLRDAIVSSEGNVEVINTLKEKWGKNRFLDSFASTHFLYLFLFFKNFNLGKTKRLFPSFLKAPGGHFYYQGKKTSFKGQEKVKKVIVTFREEFFDGHTFKVLHEEKLKELNIPL